jgi:hypothetical protein
LALGSEEVSGSRFTGAYATGNEATRSSDDAKGTSTSLISASLHAPAALHAGEAGGTSASISDPLAMLHPCTSRATPCTATGGPAALRELANGESQCRMHAAGVVSAHAGQSVRLFPFDTPSTVQPSGARRCEATNDDAGFTSARLNGLVADTPHQPAAAGLWPGPKSVQPSA